MLPEVTALKEALLGTPGNLRQVREPGRFEFEAQTLIPGVHTPSCRRHRLLVTQATDTHPWLSWRDNWLGSCLTVSMPM